MSMSFLSPTPDANIYSVSKLNRFARTILESEIGRIWLSGEISNFVAASSGHWYFTLKDNKAQIRAAMFKGANRRIAQRPKEGDHVLVKANISLYEPRGDYQLIVDHLEQEGLGKLKQEFEQLKIKLAAEGMFAQEHKQVIPQHISRLGVVTSATGAALHDILTVLKRRNPGIAVVVYPAQVQGEQAPRSLIQALQTANRRRDVDAIILGRGGGSLEDLWAFNDEGVARAIFASSIPVISAVGHEVDVTIADFVADTRAPTPSAAAELVSADSEEYHRSIQHLLSRLKQSMSKRMQTHAFAQRHLRQRLQAEHPSARLMQQNQALDYAAGRLHSAMEKAMTQGQRKLDLRHHNLMQHSPELQLQRCRQRLTFAQQQLYRTSRRGVEHKQQALARVSHLLDAVSPLATLGRGYSISFNGDHLVRSIKDVNTGDRLTHKLADGLLSTTVTAVSSSDED